MDERTPGNFGECSMRYFFIYWFVLMGFCSFGQQQEQINGIVADSATFAALPHVNIRIKNTYRGTTSDVKGNFAIQASRKDTLVFSFVGYKTVERPLYDWEPSMILMAEEKVILNQITIEDIRLGDPYSYLFEEENERLRQSTKKLPFYMSRGKKERIWVKRLENENLRVKTYVDLVINNPEIKTNLIKKHNLTEQEYYNILTRFNEKNYGTMYYLSASELLSLLNRFFTENAPKK